MYINPFFSKKCSFEKCSIQSHPESCNLKLDGGETSLCGAGCWNQPLVYYVLQCQQFWRDTISSVHYRASRFCNFSRIQNYSAPNTFFFINLDFGQENRRETLLSFLFFQITWGLKSKRFPQVHNIAMHILLKIKIQK